MSTNKQDIVPSTPAKKKGFRRYALYLSVVIYTWAARGETTREASAVRSGQGGQVDRAARPGMQKALVRTAKTRCVNWRTASVGGGRKRT